SCQNIKSLSLGEKTFKGIDMSGVYSASLYSSMNSTYYTGFWVDEADPEGSSFAPVNSRSDYLLKKHNENIAKRTYVWQGKPAKITFDKNYETGEEVYEPYDEVINTRYDQIINLSQVKPPQREGYVFKGWAESPDLADAKQKTNLNGKRVNWLDEKILYAIWSKKSSSVTQTVILVNGNSYPDTLTASVLANLKDAPILLSNFENIDTTTLNEIKRIGTTDIVIVGGNKVVSDSVVSQLQKEITGVKVSRICGEDRYQTAIKVGEEVRKLVSVSQSLTNSSNQNSVILAVGTNYPDAISVTSLAEYTNTPILLTGTDTLNEDTLNALKTWNITNVTIIGKEKAISQKVADIIKSLAISEDADNSSGSSITVERIGGEDRYETAKLIGEKLISLLGKEQTSTSTTSSSIISQAILVDGTNFPDALTVSSLLGYYKVPVLLTQQQSLNKITANALKDWSISKVTIVGGVNVVSKKIEDELKQNISSAMTIERLAGADRYETAVKISQKYSEVK
ncbi:MAG: cell wall-binding repeat-containing protein, partial [Clostridioides sp.]|nr:cell wall-binding repeat-containing protein [Clostridioides sp.]